MWDARHGPWRARLNLLNSGGSGGWIPRSSNVFQYIQVDLGQISRIVAVATQGRYEANQWVKKYEISYSKGGSKFTFYSIKKKVQVGNDCVLFLEFSHFIYFVMTILKIKKITSLETLSLSIQLHALFLRTNKFHNISLTVRTCTYYTTMHHCM